MLFGERLRNCRIAAGLTQKEAGEAVGIKLRQWQEYEAGKKMPTFERLLLISDCFDVSTDYLLGNSDNPEVSHDERDFYKEDFSNRLYFLRLQNGLKASKVAAEIGIPLATVRQLERGIINPSEEILSKFADYFNVTTDYMSGKAPYVLVDKRQGKSDDITISSNVLDSSLSSSEKLMYIALISFLSSNGETCASLEELQTCCGTSENTVLRILKSLEKKKVIQKSRQFDDSKESNIKQCYILHDIPENLKR